jgi:hypothetical protein
MKIEVVARIARPRCEFGIDYDAIRFVLARFGDKELQWHGAGQHWRSLGQYISHAATLVLHDYSYVDARTSWARHQTWEIHEGGRLSKALLKEHAKKIDEFFGVPVSKYLHSRKTVLVK